MRVAHLSRLFACLVLAMAASRPAAADTLTLMWDRSSDGSVAGYVVHVGTQSGNYSQTFDVGNATSFSFNGAASGQQYYFAVASYFPGPIVGPLSQEVSGSSSGAPLLVNPGTRTNNLGVPLTLQLSGSDPQGQPVTYGASSLPPGLSLAPTTGFISGTPTVAGTYLVTASVTDGALSDAETFTWTISQAGSSGSPPPGGTTTPPPGGTTPPPGGTTTPPPGDTTPSGDSVAPAVRITLPTTSSSYTSSQAFVTIGGTASDNVQVVRVEWSTSNGDRGTATGTDSWIAGVALASGNTTITVRAYDQAGNSAGDSIVVSTSNNTARPGTGKGRKAKHNNN
jgi:hypothetical protein